MSVAAAMPTLDELPFGGTHYGFDGMTSTATNPHRFAAGSWSGIGVSGISTTFLQFGRLAPCQRSDPGFDKVAEWSGLSENWNGEGALPPDRQALKHARSFLYRLSRRSIKTETMYIDAGGEITFSWKKQSGRAVVSFPRGGEVVIYAYLRGGDVMDVSGSFAEVWDAPRLMGILSDLR